MINENELQKLDEKNRALDIAISYGIINNEDAEKQKYMNIENYIKNEFGKYNVELKINYLESNNVYRIRVAKKLQSALELKALYFGASKKIALQKLYDDIAGKTKNKITLYELWCIWHEERKNDPMVEDPTTEKDLQLYNRWVKDSALNNRTVKSISVNDLNDFFKSLAVNKITKSSFTNLKSMLNLFFDFAVRDYQIIAFNPSRQLKTAQYKVMPESNKINDLFTSDEIIKLYHYMMKKNTVYSLACALAFCLGCRVGEIKALKWSDIDFNRNTIYIHAEVVKRGKTAGHQVYREHTKSGLTEGARELPLFKDGLAVLQKIKEKNCDTEFLFLGKTGKFILTQEFNDNIKTACDALNIQYMSSHKSRKWAATEALRNGMDEVSLMYTFGWKSLATADKYVKKFRTQQSQLTVLARTFDKSITIDD